MKHYVYIVKCKHGTYYTGSTKDLKNRMKLHDRGRGAKYLRGKGPVTLVYCREYKSLSSAMKAECRIKKLRKQQKDELINAYKK